VFEPARALGRFRWVAILLIAASFSLAACDSGGEDKASRTDASPPKLLPPAGFSGAADGFNVVLSWSAPSGSAKIIGYEIRRDGSLLRSVSSDETTLTDADVRPGKAYTYEIRSRGNGAVSEAASTDVEIAVPPLSAARVEGDFSVNAKTVSKSGYSRFATPSFGWHFRPKCAEGACNVVWRDVFEKAVHATLKRKRARYTGDYKGFFLIKCRGTRSISSVHLVLKVEKARAIGGEWRATTLAGTVTNSEASQFGCVSARAVQSVKAKLRLAG
jgi:hypothetical protein